MRVHPISLALRFLKGQRAMRAAPYRGRPLFESDEAAADVLRSSTGQDFVTDAARWGDRLRRNRRAYHRQPPANGPQNRRVPPDEAVIDSEIFDGFATKVSS